VDLETKAAVIRAFEALTVPGLLQTPEYAAELFRACGATDVDALVEERMARQQILNRDNPPILWAIATESVID